MGSQSVEGTLTQGIPLPYLDKAKEISVRIQREGWGAGSSAELNHPARRRSRTRRGLSAESGGSQSPSFSRFHQLFCPFSGLAKEYRYSTARIWRGG